jgi:hypothetical protein
MHSFFQHNLKSWNSFNPLKPGTFLAENRLMLSARNERTVERGDEGTVNSNRFVALFHCPLLPPSLGHII